ncbi:MAG: hypothetical protein IT469_01675 [Pseudomonadales bacterium]|nr:hypothetical protein [Pseudomonadales bacterium]
MPPPTPDATTTDPRDTSTMGFWDSLLGGVGGVNDAVFSHLSTPPRSSDPSPEEVRRLRASTRRTPPPTPPPVQLTNDDAGWATIASEAAQLAAVSGQARPSLPAESDDWDRLGDMAHEIAAYDLADNPNASLADSTRARLDIVRFAAARSVAADQARAVAAQSATTGDELLNRILALHLQTRGNLEKTGLELAREGWDRRLITPHLLSTIDNRIAESESAAQTALNPPPNPAGLAEPDQEAADKALAGAAALRMVKAQLLRERKLPYLPTGNRRGATLPPGLAQHPRYINIIDSPLNRGMASAVAAEQAADGTPPERGLLREVANSGVRTIGRFAGAGSAAFETAAQFIARNGGAGTPTPDTLHFAASALELVRGATHRPAFSASPSIEHMIADDGSLSFKAAGIRAIEQGADLAITVGAGTGAAVITGNPAVGVLVGAAVGSGLDTANVVSETIREQVGKGASYEDATVTGQAVGTLYAPISFITNRIPLEKFLDKSPLGDVARGYLANAARRATVGAGAEIANEVPQTIWQDFSAWAATNDPETWKDWETRYGEAALWAAVLGGGANVAMHAPADAAQAREAALGPNPLDRVEPAAGPTPSQKAAMEALAAVRAPTRAKAIQALRNINGLTEQQARILPTDEYTDQHRRLAALGEALGIEVAFLDGDGRPLAVSPGASSRSGTVVLDAHVPGPAASLEFFQHEIVHEAAGRAAERGLTEQWSTLLKAVREADPAIFKAATAGYEAAAKEAGIELDPDQLGEEALATIAQSIAGRVLWGNVNMPDLVRMAERAPTAFQHLLGRAKGLLRRIGVPMGPSLAEEIRGRGRIARIALELREAGELLRQTADDVPVAGPNVEALALDESEYTPPDPDQAIPLSQPGATPVTQDRREAYRREFRQRQQQAGRPPGRPLRGQPPTGIDTAPQDATVPLDVAPDSDLAQTLPVDTAGGIPPRFNPYISPAAEVESPIAVPGRQGPGAARITGGVQQAGPTRPRIAPRAATGTAEVPPPYRLADEGDSSEPPPPARPAGVIQPPGGPNASSVAGSAQPRALSEARVTGTPSGTSSSLNPGDASTQALRAGTQASTLGEPPGPPATIRIAVPSDQAGPNRTSPARKFRVGRVDKATNRKILQASGEVQRNIELAVQKQAELDERAAQAIQGIEGAAYDKSRTKTAEPGKPVPSPRIIEKADPANATARPAHTISDYLAARIIVESPAAMEAATKALREAFTTEFRPDIEDFSVAGKPKKGGYRSRNIQVDLGGGFTAEVQLVPRPIYAARKRTHALYESMRSPGADDQAAFRASHEAQRINRAAIETYLQSLDDTQSEPGNRVPSAEVRLTKAKVIQEVKRRFSDFATKRLLKDKNPATVGERMLEIIEAVPGVDLYSPEYRDDQSRMFALAEYVLRGEGSRLDARNLVGIDAGKLKVGDTWRIGATIGARWRFAVIASDDSAVVVRAWRDAAIPGLPESRGYHYILPRDGGLGFAERGTLTRAESIAPASPDTATDPKPVDTRTLEQRIEDDAAARQARYARANARAAEFREGLPDIRFALRLRGDEAFGPTQDLAQARRSALAFAKSLVGRMVVNTATGRRIAIGGSGIDKALSGKRSLPHYQSVAALPALLESAVPVSEAPDSKGRNTIRAVHTFADSIEIAGAPYLVRIIVRETTNGDYFYDHHLVADGAGGAQKEGPAVKAGEGMVGDQARSLRPALGPSDKSTPPTADTQPSVFALRNARPTELDQFTRDVPRALAERPPRTIGRPDLANPGLTEPQRRVIDAADQARPQPEALADQIVAERAAERLARNAEAERRALLARVDRGELLDVADVAVAQELVRRAADRVLAEGSREAHLEAIKLHEAYRQSGTDQARAFRMRRDRVMGPAERARQFLAAAIAEPVQGDRARIDRIRRRLRDQDHPPTPEREGQLRQQLERIYERAADQAERIRRDVAAAGFDPASITDELLDQPREAARLIRTVAAARATLGDKLTEYWINSILSAPTTQAANIIGNAAFGAYEFLGRRIVEGGFNQLAGNRADTSAATLGEYAAIARAIEPGLRLAGRNFLEAYATEIPVLSRQVGGPDSARIDIGSRTAIRGRLGRAVRAMGGRPLMAFDEAFRSLWATMDAHARAHRQAFGAERLAGAAGWDRVRELVADIHSPIWEQSLDTATHLAFQDRPTALGRAALAARREFNAAARVPLATFILPFITTPDRILAAGLRLTPLVGIKTVADVAQGRLDWRNRGHIARALAENIVAWGLFLGIKAIADSRDEQDRPLITGSTPGQRGARELAYRTAPPMSIRIGDKYVSYSRIEPFATALGLVVDATQAPADAGELYEQAITTLKNQLQDKTFLKGLSDIMAIVDQPSSSEGKALSMAQHIATGFVPNVLQAAQRSADATIRDRAIRGSDQRGMAATALRRGLEQAAPAVFTPPPRIDLWGREVDARQAGTGLSDFAYRFTVPIRLTDVDRATRFDLLINRYNSAVPDADRFLPEPPRPTIQRTVNGERTTFRLSDAEFVRYQREAGRMAAERLANTTLNFDKPTERDIERIKKALDDSRRRVADQIVATRQRPPQDPPRR